MYGEHGKGFQQFAVQMPERQIEATHEELFLRLQAKINQLPNIHAVRTYTLLF